MFFSTNEWQHKDTLAIGLFQKSQLSGKAKEMDELLEGRITELLKEGDISSKRNQLSKFFPSPETGIKRIYFVGLGKESDYTFEEAK
ncbi:M17 family peptidase N-terminal domain-containing protein, partial [Bacillus pumilus]